MYSLSKRSSKCIGTGVWYYYVNHLSSDTRLEKISTIFGQHMEVKGQKSGIFGKIHHFLWIFYLKEAVYVLKLVYDITMSVIFQVIPVWRRSEQLLDSIWRSKVKKGHFGQNFAFSVWFCCLSYRIFTRTGVYYCCFNHLSCITS